VDEGQARVNRFVVVAPCPRRHPQPDAVLLKSQRGFVVRTTLEAAMQFLQRHSCLPYWQQPVPQSFRF
jgi:hypothetical protein